MVREDTKLEIKWMREARNGSRAADPILSASTLSQTRYWRCVICHPPNKPAIGALALFTDQKPEPGRIRANLQGHTARMCQR